MLGNEGLQLGVQVVSGGKEVQEEEEKREEAGALTFARPSVGIVITSML